MVVTYNARGGTSVGWPLKKSNAPGWEGAQDHVVSSHGRRAYNVRVPGAGTTLYEKPCLIVATDFLDEPGRFPVCKNCRERLYQYACVSEPDHDLTGLYEEEDAPSGYSSDGEPAAAWA